MDYTILVQIVVIPSPCLLSGGDRKKGNAVKKRSLLSFLVIGLLAALLALYGLWSTIKNVVKKRSLLSFLVIGLLAALLAFCGFWSTIKNVVKKVWRAVKAVVRIVVRVVILVI